MAIFNNSDGSIKERRINKGVVYRASNQQWYPVHRVGATLPWTLYTTKEHELPTPIHFSTEEAALKYIEEN